MYTAIFKERGIELLHFQRLTLAFALDSAYFHKQYVNAMVEIYNAYGNLVCVLGSD